MQIKSIAFDLDDTLLGTTEVLVPAASRAAFQVLIESGLSLDLEACEEFRLEMIKTISHKDVFLQLSQKFGSEKTMKAVEKAIDLFYNPSVPDTLPLLPLAQENLDYLSKKYTLYLVTAGFKKGQESKIKSLGIAKYFKQVFIVDSLNNERKKDAFQKILELDRLQPAELLCIGNSLSSEIKDAKELGCRTCYFEYGEDRGKDKSDPMYSPDYHVTQHSDLIIACQL